MHFSLKIWEKFHSVNAKSTLRRHNFERKMCTKSRLFTVKRAMFPKNWPLVFYFFPYFYFCIPFYVGSGSKSGSGNGMLAVPVPLRQKLRFLRFRFHNTASHGSFLCSLYGEWFSETWEPVPCNQMCDNCDKSGGSAIPTDVTSTVFFFNNCESL